MRYTVHDEQEAGAGVGKEQKERRQMTAYG
jgi:hypothetical protein